MTSMKVKFRQKSAKCEGVGVAATEFNNSDPAGATPGMHHCALCSTKLENFADQLFTSVLNFRVYSRHYA